MGWELEILPKTPLDHVMPNQPVEFEVRYMGEPLGCTPNEMEFLLAASNTYGGEGAGDTDGFFLAAYLMGGKARMSFPTAGEWVVTVFTNKPVLPDGKFDAYKNECKQVFHSAGLSLNVRTI